MDEAACEPLSATSVRRSDGAQSFRHLRSTACAVATRRLPRWLFLIGRFGRARPRQLLSQYAKQPAPGAALRLVGAAAGIPPPAFTLALSRLFGGLLDELPALCRQTAPSAPPASFHSYYFLIALSARVSCHQSSDGAASRRPQPSFCLVFP